MRSPATPSPREDRRAEDHAVDPEPVGEVVAALLERRRRRARVTRHATPKIGRHPPGRRAGVRMRLIGCRFSRPSPAGPAARHRDAPARVLGRPVDPVDADDPDDDDPERGRADPPADRGRRLQQRAHLHAGDDEDDEQCLEHRRQPPDEVRERPRRPDGEVAEEQHHRLDGDAADQVPGGERQVPRGGGRDRDRELRKRSGDREQDQSAELVAQPEPRVQRVGRLREGDARDPGGGRRRPGRSGRAGASRARPRRKRCGRRRTEQLRPPRRS